MSRTAVISDYPHKCFACGSAAYCGLTTVDCSNGGCVHGKKVVEAPEPSRSTPSGGPLFRRSLFEPGEYHLEILQAFHKVLRNGKGVVYVGFRIHESVSPYLSVGGEITWVASNPRALPPLIQAVGTDVIADMVGKFVRARAENAKTKMGLDYVRVTFEKDVP